jgi:perosamine synthetase
MSWKIPLFKMYWDESDIVEVNAAIKSGMSWAAGPQIARFEKELAGYIGTDYCTTFSSGTSSLHALLLAYGIGPDDEVIVPSFTFIATANAPKFVGAKPVFADIEASSFGLDPKAVERVITHRTKAILPVHYGGFPCKIRELEKIAKNHGIILIEDAAEAFGASVNGKMVGTFGDSAILSFCQNKIITTGEGGAVVTSNRALFDQLKLIRSHGRSDTIDYFSTTDVLDYFSLGYNMRISTMTAALGIAQLGKIEFILKERKADAEYYGSRLAEIEGITVPAKELGTVAVYQLYSVLAEKRDKLIKYLETKGIMTKVYFSPVHTTHYYRNVLGYTDTLSVTDAVAGKIISLPFYPGISRADMDCVIEEIETFYRMV